MREHIPTIRLYARDPNEVVRIAAIVCLSDCRDEESRDAFEDAAKSLSVRLERCGQAAIKWLDSRGSAIKREDSLNLARCVVWQFSTATYWHLRWLVGQRRGPAAAVHGAAPDNPVRLGFGSRVAVAE